MTYLPAVDKAERALGAYNGSIGEGEKSESASSLDLITSGRVTSAR